MKKLLFLSWLVLASCSPESKIKPTMDRTNQDITLKVIFHDTKASLEDVYREMNNLDSNAEVPDQWGFAAWNEQRSFDGTLLASTNNICTVHTFQPKRQNDQLVRTMGHELLHCIYGSYHN